MNIRKQKTGSFLFLTQKNLPSLGPDRTLRVYVPFYCMTRKTNPVLILFDGQNVFDDGPSYAGGWFAHHAVEKLSKDRQIPILIGVDHGKKKRLDELSPWTTEKGGGKADPFLDWLVTIGLPDIKRRLELSLSPESTYLAGSSLGGLAALYAHFRHPETFGGAICMSPSFWVHHQEIFKYVDSQPIPKISRIYMDGGLLESNGHLCMQICQMEKKFLAKGMNREDFLTITDRKGTHSERDWRRRFPNALRFMYRKMKGL